MMSYKTFNSLYIVMPVKSKGLTCPSTHHLQAGLPRKELTSLQSSMKLAMAGA